MSPAEACGLEAVALECQQKFTASSCKCRGNGFLYEHSSKQCIGISPLAIGMGVGRGGGGGGGGGEGGLWGSIEPFQ